MSPPYLADLSPDERAPEVLAADLRAAERAALGFCLGAHPCAGVRGGLEAEGAVSLSAGLRPGPDRVFVGAVVRHTMEKRTRRGEWMGVLWLEDERTRSEAVCYPRSWPSACEACEAGPDEPVVLDARPSDGKLVVSGARLLSGAPTAGQVRVDRLRGLARELGDFVALDLETCLSAEVPPAALETAQAGPRGRAWAGSRGSGRGRAGGPPSSKPMTEAQKADLGWLWRQRVVEVACVFYQRVDAWWVAGRRGPQCVPQWREWQRVCRRVRPEGPIADMQTHVHGISDADVRGLPTLRERALRLAEVLRGRTLVTYNGRVFDLPVLRRELERCGAWLGHGSDVDLKAFTERRYLGLAQRPDSLKLGDQARFWGVELGKAHSAADDAAATGQVLVKMIVDSVTRGA